MFGLVRAFVKTCGHIVLRFLGFAAVGWLLLGKTGLGNGYFWPNSVV